MQKRRKAKKASSEDPGISPKLPNSVSGADQLSVVKGSLISEMKDYGEVSDSLLEALRLPPKLYPGNAMKREMFSYSFPKDRNIEAVASALLEGAELPDVTVRYGIEISGRLGGSVVCCTFVDMNADRKVIVFEPITNIHAKQGSWGSFEASLRKALELSKSLKDEGRKFKFVLFKEGSGEPIF